MPDQPPSSVAPPRPPRLFQRQFALPKVQRADALCFLVLVAVTLLALPASIWRGQAFFERDIQFMWYAQTEAFVRSIAAGAWPVWNPLLGFGKPLWADANSQVLYPLTWLHLVLPPWAYYKMFVILHLIVAGTGAFALLRRLALSRPAALVGGCLWIASGPLLSAVNLWNQLAGAAWMPWALLAADRALRQGRRRDILAWAALQAGQILAGSPETALMTGLAIAVYAVGLLAWSARDGRERVSMVLRAALALAFAVGLSAAQWIPSGEVAVRAGRAHLPLSMREYWSVHPLNLIQVLLPPRLDQLPLLDEQRERLFDSREPLLASLYLGLPAVGLIGAAFLGPGRRVRWMAAGLTLVAGLTALGRYTPVFGLLTSVVPLARGLRFPPKAMLGVALGFSLLAGFGVDAWRRREPGTAGRRYFVAALLPLLAAAVAALTAAWITRYRPEAWRALLGDETRETYAAWLAPMAWSLARAGLLALLALAALIAALYGRLGGTAAALLVSGTCVVELLANHHDLNRTAPHALFTFRPPVLDALKPPEASRVYVYDYFTPGRSQRYLGRLYPFFALRVPSGWPDRAAAGFAMHVYLFPPSSAFWGVPGSYDRETAAVAPEYLVQLAEGLRSIEGTPGHLRLLQIGAVSRMVSLHTDGLSELQPLAALPGWLPEPIRVFGVPDALPRVYAVSGARVADGLAALRTLVHPAFDPRAEVVLPSGEARPALSSFKGEARLAALGPDRMRVDAVLSAPGYVVMVEAFDPGWKATVDGRPAPMLRANVGFRAVAVPAGNHTIECRYAPSSIVLGLGVSLATLIAAGLLAKAPWAPRPALPALDASGGSEASPPALNGSRAGSAATAASSGR